MSDKLELEIDPKVLVGAVIGAIVATLWSTAPLFLPAQTASAFSTNRNALLLLGALIAGGSIFAKVRTGRKGLEIPKVSLYTGVTAFLVVGLIGYMAIPISGAVQNSGTADLGGKNLRKATLKVKGMVCQGCRLTVKNYLESMEGTEKVSVTLSKRQAEVIYNPDKLSENEIVNAKVFRGAYSAKLVEDKEYSG